VDRPVREAQYLSCTAGQLFAEKARLIVENRLMPGGLDRTLGSWPHTKPEVCSGGFKLDNPSNDCRLRQPSSDGASASPFLHILRKREYRSPRNRLTTLCFVTQLVLLSLLAACAGYTGSHQAQSSVSLNLDVAPATLDLGNVMVSHQSPAQAILVSNNSAGSVTVSNIAVSGPFAATGNTVPMTLSAGQSMPLNVRFTPNSSGMASGSLTITSTAENSPSVVSLQGTGTPTTGPLNLTIAPASLNFGTVAVSTPSAAQTILVSNNSAGSVAVSKIAVSGPFASKGNFLPITLSSGQTLPLNVTFTPNSSGMASGSLTITSTAANSPSVVSLQGTGTPTTGPLNLTIAPTSLNFGIVSASDAGPAQTLFVSNNSSGPITVNNIGVSGPFASAGNTLPITLSVGQSVTLKVTFTPTASGTANGTVTITSNASNSPATVSLAGNQATCNITFNAGDDLPGIVNANPADTTFCFSSGTYRMTSYVTPKTNDAFIGLSIGAILNGSQLVTSWTQSGNYWIAENQPQLIPQTSDVCATATSLACQFPDALFLDSTPLNRVMSLSAVVPGTFYRDYANKQIYVADNPNGHTMEVIVSSLPFLAVGTGAVGVTIEGLTIEKFAGNAQGAVQGSATWTIQNNEVRLNHGDGIEAEGKVLGNYAHDNGDFGLEGGFATTAMDVENNELAFNNWANFANGGGAKFEYATNLVVRNNFTHDNNGAGLHTDGDCSNVLYEYNHTKNNLNFGIEHEISWEAIIRYNLLENETSVSAPHLNNTIWARPAIGIFNSSGVQVYGNTITNSANGIGAILVNRGNSNHAPNTGQPYLLKNLDVHDNTFSEITYEAAGLIRTSDFDTSVYTSWNNHFTNNTYSLGDLSGLYFVWLDSSGKNSYAPHTWVQWQSFGNDVGGTFHASNP
jgi:hypothetical protein